MPVRIADLQAIVNQTPNVERLQHFQLHQPRAHADMLGAQFAQEAAERQRRVDENRRGEYGVINDQQGRGRRPAMRILKRRQEEHSVSPATIEGLGQHIDVLG